MKHPARFAIVFGFLFLSAMSCISIEAKRPVFKNTKWFHTQQTFVADAGNMTETTTLEFGSENDVLIRNRWVLPAHPAMYMRADGTVETIPESSSESVKKGSWKYTRRTLTVTLEDGIPLVFTFKNDTLFLQEPDGAVKDFLPSSL